MRLLRIKEVKEKTGLSKTAIYDNMNAGQFPRNISLGVRAVAWLESEVDEWIQGRCQTLSYTERWLSKRNQELINTVFGAE